MKNQNGTPATTETPREQYLSECLTERREVLAKTRKEVFALQCANDALTAKAAALDALVGIAGEAATLLGGLIDSEAFDYCNDDGGERVGSELSPTEARIMANRDTLAALYSALSAAKAAQVSK